jgi:hypothetical protein
MDPAMAPRESGRIGREQMNRLERRTPVGGPAELDYFDGDFKVSRPGAYVICAATGARIALEDLRYWSVDLQEPYAGPEAKALRMKQLGETP